MLDLFKEMLLEGYMISNRNYEDKKRVCLMVMKYKKIHASLNDFILYKKLVFTLNMFLCVGFHDSKRNITEVLVRKK